MGSSYSNISLRGPDRARVIAALERRGRQAYVGPEAGGWIVVFDEETEDDPNEGAAFAQELSRELGGVALLAMVYDEDIFVYSLARDGEVVDQYNSAPGYFEGDDSPPEGGDAAVLCAAAGHGSPEAVEKILRAPANADDYVYETARHAAFAEALGLPGHSVNLGYGHVHQGEAGEVEAELTRVGGDVAAAPHVENPMELMRARLADAPAGAEALASIEAMNAAARNPAHGYFPALLAGDAAAVRALFAGEPVLDDPLGGKVDGAGMDAHVAAAHALLAGASASYGPVGMIESPERVVAHGQIVGQAGGEPVILPCACVWERAEGGGFRELRAYWSPAGVKGQRGERPPVLEPRPELALPEPVAAHLKALAADDIAAVVATYDAGCLMPIPLPWLDAEDTVRRHYGAQLGEQGAIVLTPCAVTATAAACALEYVTTKWDGADVPPQAGVVVFELRGGKICQVHLFGDLAPSPMAGLGGLGDLGGMGGMAGLGDLGAMGGMAGLGDLGGLGGGMDISPEAMQQAMDQAMKMLGGGGGIPGMGNLGDMMKSLQEMMGGAGGAGGMPGMGDLSGLQGFAGLPGMGGMPHGWDDEEDGAADPDAPDAAAPDEDAGDVDHAADEGDTGASDQPPGGAESR